MVYVAEYIRASSVEMRKRLVERTNAEEKKEKEWKEATRERCEERGGSERGKVLIRHPGGRARVTTQRETRVGKVYDTSSLPAAPIRPIKIPPWIIYRDMKNI